MTDDESPPVPFVPLPMAGEGPPTGKGSAALGEVRVVYLKYRDPKPLEFPDRPGLMGGPIFHAGGVLLREDDEFLALGEVAFADENDLLAGRYGADLFPAYRNILTVPKASNRRTAGLRGATGTGPRRRQVSEPGLIGQS